VGAGEGGKKRERGRGPGGFALAVVGRKERSPPRGVPSSGGMGKKKKGIYLPPR